MSDVPTPTLSVCVVNYQGTDFLEATVDEIRTFEAPAGEVLVVDHGSTDGSAEIAARRGDVTLSRLPVKRGPGPARNVARRRAGHELLLFLDDDVGHDPECPRILAAELRASGATLAIPRIVFTDHMAIVQCDGASAHPSGLLAFENAEWPVADCSERPRETQSLVTSCFLLDRARWGAADPFDELFFVYLEDHDLGPELRGCRAVQRARRVPDREILSGGPHPFADRLLQDRLDAAAGRSLDRAAAGWWRLLRGWL